ncbi:PREDICTED: protein AIG2-like isoform X3 [Brassica oleracea var. oleracea]|uniref:protein AIG2-like isoform X3 n=1 Tax=Brassica oleracea var. oleracea TaxID=109376 RepID=UPI0006A6EC98|nr:PREDICTED: protein AIG2-like isoform X3 [Brassica oleracea var. oleracea]
MISYHFTKYTKKIRKKKEEEVKESRLRYEAINRALLTHLSHTHFFKHSTIRKKKKMSSSVSPSHNVFVYGSFQEPAVVGLILECTPVIVSAQLHGFHVYRLKGRLHACISPSENGLTNGKILTGLTDGQLENLDMIEGDEYERKTVEVVLTEWKRLHMEKFIEASKKFIEWKKNPNGKTREEFAKFVNEDPPVA